MPPPSTTEVTGSRGSSHSHGAAVVEEEEEKVGFENSNHSNTTNNNNNHSGSGSGTSDAVVAFVEPHGQGQGMDFSSDEGQRVVSKDGLDKEQGLGQGLGQGMDGSIGIEDHTGGNGGTKEVGVGVMVPTLTTVSSTHSSSTTRGGDRTVIPKSEISSTTR